MEITINKKDKLFNRTFEFQNEILSNRELIDRLLALNTELYQAYLLKEIFLDSYHRYDLSSTPAFIEITIISFEGSN